MRRIIITLRLIIAEAFLRAAFVAAPDGVDKICLAKAIHGYIKKGIWRHWHDEDEGLREQLISPNEIYQDDKS